MQRLPVGVLSAQARAAPGRSGSAPQLSWDATTPRSNSRRSLIRIASSSAAAASPRDSSPSAGNHPAAADEAAPANADRSSVYGTPMTQPPHFLARSRPGPPEQLSRRGPPLRWSFPGPPVRRSRPPLVARPPGSLAQLSPRRTSAPDRPWRASFPVPVATPVWVRLSPISRSLFGPPLRSSFPPPIATPRGEKLSPTTRSFPPAPVSLSGAPPTALPPLIAMLSPISRSCPARPRMRSWLLPVASERP